ncbi:hypothetical protein [Nocardiopsis synnemataformans]|uniref:hypothetical protein n=1 Tax=Nocardiopsis synnemataformans TaxID=61305 RepID=UPI003EC1528A
MALYVCSLDVSLDQEIPNDEAYHLLRFPHENPNYDPWGMHSATQPDGCQVTAWESDDRSGLIWPTVAGWGTLTAEIQWAGGDYGELRDRFVRDPLGTPNETNLEDRCPTGGMQFVHKCHQIFVNPSVPLGLQVKHNASKPVKVTYAQFKISVETDVASP